VASYADEHAEWIEIQWRGDNMSIGDWMVCAAGAALICGCYKTVTVPNQGSNPAPEESAESGPSVEFEFDWDDGTRIRAQVERTIQMNEQPKRRLETEYLVEVEAVEEERSAVEAIETRPDLMIRTRENRVLRGDVGDGEWGFLEYVAAANLGVRANLRVGPEGALQNIGGTEEVSARQMDAMRAAAGRELSSTEEKLLGDSLKPSLLKSRSKADWSFWVESWAGQTMEVGRSYTEEVPVAWDTRANDATMTMRVAALESCGMDRCARIEVVIETDGETIRRAMEERATGSGVEVDETFLRETHTLWTVPETLIPRRVAHERVVRATLTSVSEPESPRHYRQTVRTETSFSQTQ
jgi:hypothetical protein